MPKILIIADDLTGAAEMGGIAHQTGLSVRIVFDFLNGAESTEDVTIIDTNTRQLPAHDARLKIEALLQKLHLAEYDLVFKKIDSVLRGNIEAEIQAFFSTTFFDSALLAPANPTKKRTIKNGKYFIGDVPINKTGFRLDPHFPRKNKTVKKLFQNGSIEVVARAIPQQFDAGKIYIPDVWNSADVDELAARSFANNLLLVGGADFFQALLAKKLRRINNKRNLSTAGLSAQKVFVMGSNSESGLQTLSFLSAKKYRVFQLPLGALDDQKHFKEWAGLLIAEFREGRNIAIATPAEFIRKHSRRLRLTKKMIETAAQLMMGSTADNLFFVEGGETASSLFRYLGWRELFVQANFDAGVVMLWHKKTNHKVIIKPGSYKWPEVITEKL